MYTLLKNSGVKKFLSVEMPPLGLSLILAEEFYKFGSFLLECGAFLTTWYLVSFIYQKAVLKQSDVKQREEPSAPA